MRRIPWAFVISALVALAGHACSSSSEKPDSGRAPDARPDGNAHDAAAPDGAVGDGSVLTDAQPDGEVAEGDQLCSLPDGVEQPEDAPCGQCGHRCLAGCDGSRCHTEFVYPGASRGPYVHNGSLFVAKTFRSDGDDSYEVFQVPPDGEATRLEAKDRVLAAMGVGGGHLFWLDRVREDYSRTRLWHRRIGEGESAQQIAEGVSVSLFRVTERGVYVLDEGALVVLEADGSRHTLAEGLDVDRPLDLVQAEDTVYLVTSAGGVHAIPYDGGEATQVTEPSGRSLAGALLDEGTVYAADRSDFDQGIVALDLSGEARFRDYVSLGQGYANGPIQGPLVIGDHLWWAMQYSLHRMPLEAAGTVSFDEERSGQDARRHAVHTDVTVHSQSRFRKLGDRLYFLAESGESLGLVSVPLP